MVCILFVSSMYFADAQKMETTFVSQFSLKADKFIGADPFDNFYYIKSATFYKKTNAQTYSYTNTQLGEITSIDITNPLKIILFYRDFNTVVILDNRLNELTDSINLTIDSFFKNVAFVSISSNNNLWLYSLDDNILSLWNFETKNIIFNSQPLSFYKENFEATKQTSNYEYCWLAAKNGVLQFNEYGSFVTYYKRDHLEKITPYLNGYLFLEKSKIYYNNSNSEIKEVLIDKPKHKIDDFTVTKNNLYFFDANVVYKYLLLKK